MANRNLYSLWVFPWKFQHNQVIEDIWKKIAKVNVVIQWLHYIWLCLVSQILKTFLFSSIKFHFNNNNKYWMHILYILPFVIITYLQIVNPS
jgi:hypothetical protein